MVGRLIFVSCMLALAAAMGGARCIENTAVKQDEQGYTYALGEIYNDTDVNAVGVRLRARLLDASGNVLASKDTGTCPPDLRAKSIAAYGLRFDERNLPSGLKLDVRPIAGTTLTAPQPPSGLELTNVSAKRQGTSLGVNFRLRNGSQNQYRNLWVCIVMYESEGNVGSWSPYSLSSVGASTLLPAHGKDVTTSLWGQSQAAATIRVWVWEEGTPAGTSRYQSVMSDRIPIAP